MCYSDAIDKAIPLPLYRVQTRESAMTSLMPELRVYQSRRLGRFKMIVSYRLDRDEEPGLLNGLCFFAIPTECRFERPATPKHGILEFRFSDMKEFRGETDRYYSYVARGIFDKNLLSGVTLGFYHATIGMISGACDADAKDLD